MDSLIAASTLAILDSMVRAVALVTVTLPVNSSISGAKAALFSPREVFLLFKVSIFSVLSTPT